MTHHQPTEWKLNGYDVVMEYHEDGSIMAIIPELPGYVGNGTYVHKALDTLAEDLLAGNDPYVKPGYEKTFTTDRQISEWWDKRRERQRAANALLPQLPKLANQCMHPTAFESYTLCVDDHGIRHFANTIGRALFTETDSDMGMWMSNTSSTTYPRGMANDWAALADVLEEMGDD